MDNMMDIELFISEIQSRPAVWDTKSYTYSNRVEKIKAWEEICELFVANFTTKSVKEKNIAVTKLQRKWKSLRDSFSRENAKSKKIASGSAASSSKQYIYYNQLSFLNCLKEVRPSLNVVETNNAEIGDQHESSRTQIKKTTRGSADKTENEILKRLSDNLKRKYEAKEDDSNPDKQFLMSLLPHVNKIDERYKLDFQTDVLQLVKKYTDMPDQSYEAYLYPSISTLTSTTIQLSPTHSYNSDQPVDNTNKYSTQNSTTATRPRTTIQLSPTHSYHSDQPVGNTNKYSTQNSTKGTRPRTTIQPSPTHSYYSDQSVDNTNVYSIQNSTTPTRPRTTIQLSPTHSYNSDQPVGNTNKYSTQNSTTGTRSRTTIQPSPTHSYYSDQSVDNSSVIEDMFRDDTE